MLDLIAHRDEANGPGPQPWSDEPAWWAALGEATAALPAPLAVVEERALAFNALDLLVRAGGTPIRVATKSVRVREVLDAVLRLPGYRGLMAFTLPEALWLARDHDDVLLGYPTVDRAALEALLQDEEAARRVTLMVDGPEQLDLIDSLRPVRHRPEVRVALEVDASWRAPLLGHVGVRRSPLRTARDAASLAGRIARRPGYRLVGLMMYEAQIAGVPDRGDAVVRGMQSRSRRELRARRAEVVAAVRAVAELEFVNGGGTGSLETTAAEEAVTEVTAGSGLLAGHLFDGYRAFTPAPAAAFALDVVRRPAPGVVTVLGGGWIASGPSVASRQPRPVWPPGLRTLPREGAGEVQTPLRGAAARRLRPGDRVWFRHAKSGELAERVDEVVVVRAGEVTGTTPTYRGEGRAFL